MKFEISDWVQAKTDHGELVHGFIEAISRVQGIVRVHVVQSDNVDSVGKPVAVRESALKKLPDISMDESVNILSLIDIALATWDEQWFQELSAKLLTARKDVAQNDSNPAHHLSHTNRFEIGRGA
jgi:hypothetical protein